MIQHQRLVDVAEKIGLTSFQSTSGTYYGKTAGTGKKSIILQHGITGNSMDMVLLMEQFVSRGYSVYSLDLPGHGDAPFMNFESFDELGDWLKGFIDEVSQPVALIGNSFGSAVCYNYAARYMFPENMKLFLCCPTPEIARMSDILRRANEIVPSRLASYAYNCQPAIWLRARIMHRNKQQDSYKWLVESEYFKRAFIDTHQVNLLMKLFMEQNPYTVYTLPENVQIRTTVFFGNRDNVILSTTPAIIRKIFNAAQLRELPGVGHILHFEAQDEIAVEVLGAIV